MENNYRTLNRQFRDHHGVIVNVIRYERDSQRVIYRRPGYEWEFAVPLILFRARFEEIYE